MVYVTPEKEFRVVQCKQKLARSMKPTSILLPRKTIIRSLTRTFPPSGMRITISHHEWFLTAKFGTLTT